MQHTSKSTLLVNVFTQLLIRIKRAGKLLFFRSFLSIKLRGISGTANKLEGEAHAGFSPSPHPSPIKGEGWGGYEVPNIH